MKSKEQTLDELAEEEAIKSAPLFGIHPNVAKDYIRAVMDRTMMRHGGDCYVPKCNRYRRNEAMKARFNGVNLKEIADEFKVSERQARRILLP